MLSQIGQLKTFALRSAVVLAALCGPPAYGSRLDALLNQYADHGALRPVGGDVWLRVEIAGSPAEKSATLRLTGAPNLPDIAFAFTSSSQWQRFIDVWERFRAGDAPLPAGEFFHVFTRADGGPMIAIWTLDDGIIAFGLNGDTYATQFGLAAADIERFETDLRRITEYLAN